MLSLMHKPPLLSLIVQDLSIFPHVPGIHPRRFVIDSKVILVVFMQENFLASTKDKILFYFKLFQVFGRKLNLGNSLV